MYNTVNLAPIIDSVVYTPRSFHTRFNLIFRNTVLLRNKPCWIRSRHTLNSPRYWVLVYMYWKRSGASWPTQVSHYSDMSLLNTRLENDRLNDNNWFADSAEINSWLALLTFGDWPASNDSTTLMLTDSCSIVALATGVCCTLLVQWQALLVSLHSQPRLLKRPHLNYSLWMTHKHLWTRSKSIV